MSVVGREIADLDTPALWVDLDKLESNIAHLASHFSAAGVGWRPHTKGIKVPAIAHKAIAAGAIGVTCAKLGEAEVMAYAGIHDILIANQIVGAIKIARLVSLLHHADVKVAVDHEDNLAELGAAAQAKGVELGVLVEVDTGMHRAGVAPGEPALALSQIAYRTEGLRYMGLMAWEGHTVDIEDPETKRREVERAVTLLTDSADRCRQAGLPVTIVSCGGSGTAYLTPDQPGVTEVQAGGGMLCDPTYQSWGMRTEPSLFVKSTVTSRPVPDRIIFDVGFKSLPDWAGKPEPVGLPGVKRMSMSAEHGSLTMEEPNSTVKLGDRFDFMVGYGDATVFLYDQLYGVRDGVVEVVWPILGRGKLQ